MSNRSVIVDERFCFEEETQLTVHKTSIFFPGDGFIVYDSAGEIVLRVDSYGPDSHSKNELFLMDSSGKSLVTVIRKKPSLHQRWEGFLGEKKDGQEPLFSIHKASIIGQSDVVVEVFGNQNEEYHIEGSFSQRSCSIYNSTFADSKSKELVAEIKRKVDPDTNIMLGKDVFLLCIKPGIDGAFTMALVLVLDNMDWHDIEYGYGLQSFVGDGSS